ncbi:hypothetical protein N7574_16695, partial [Acinetobacter ursingii]
EVIANLTKNIHELGEGVVEEESEKFFDLKKGLDDEKEILNNLIANQHELLLKIRSIKNRLEDLEDKKQSIEIDYMNIIKNVNENHPQISDKLKFNIS